VTFDRVGVSRFLSSVNVTGTGDPNAIEGTYSEQKWQLIQGSGRRNGPLTGRAVCV
jgi:hypothetical protein